MTRRRKIFVGLGVLLALVVAYVARGWAPDVPVAQLKARWAKPPSTFIRLEGLDVHVRDEGLRDDPAPLVLLHGTSASLHTWEGWAQRLTSHHRVVSLDLPGFGLTGGFPDGDMSVAHSLRVLVALLDALHVERCVLVGNSYGGRLAWEFALAHPTRVSRLVLVDAAGYARNSVSVPLGFRLIQLPGFGAVAEKLLPRGVIERSVRNVYGDPSRVTPELVDRYYELTRREGNRRALVQRMEQVPAEGDTGRLKQLTMKTLVLWGKKDELIPLDSGARFDADIPDSELVVFEGLGHVPQEEDPETTVAVLERFLAKP